VECRSRRSGGRPGTVSALVRDLPVADLGCGNGRQTMFLGQHFTTVIGTDISPAAIEQARAARTLRTSDSASWISAGPTRRSASTAMWETSTSTSVACCTRCPRATGLARWRASHGCSAIPGHCSTKSLPRRPTSYFAAVVERFGVSPVMERMMRLIPPEPMSEEDLVSLYSNGFDVVSKGRSHIHTSTACQAAKR